MKHAIIKFYLLNLLLILRIDAYTQCQWLDSVKNVSESEKEDTNKVNSLLVLASYYINTHADTGVIYSQNIVKAHGGELKVETKDGEGSEFIIQLPFV